ncbi:TonB-dependent siderophore receptor [Avrilella dinanensis]|uniref:Uncharacterized protein n=1 Tax=Avrilella dinanensis TaxID=2008672 RepID=A0A2M9R7F6_9FLAO|nr:TonB-dependent receptor [Avrilella dinanensis]PJR04784.1 hypothetical protein CDL10_09715 [Avrilella dinanensis]
MKSKYLILGTLMLATVTTSFAQEKQPDSLQTELDEIIIHIQNNNSKHSSKMPLKNIEDPQVYNVINAGLMENQMIFTLEDAFNNVPGLQMMWKSTGRAGDGGTFVNLRGFSTNNSLRNGLSGIVSTELDAFNIEKVEIIKGPSATLFGGILTTYGGVINRVTKKPFDFYKGSVTLSGGSNDYRRGHFDINLPLRDDNKLLFRMNTAYVNEKSFQPNIFNRQFAFSPVLSFIPSDKLRIDVEFEHFNRTSVGEQMFFLYDNPIALGLDGKDIRDLGADYNQSYWGKGLTTKSISTNFFGTVNYKFSDNIISTTSVSTSYSFSHGYGPYIYLISNASLLQDPDAVGNSLLLSSQSTDNSKSKTLEIQQNFNFNFKIGNMENKLLVGLDYLRKDDDIHFYNVTGVAAHPVGSSLPFDGNTFNKSTVDLAMQENGWHYPSVGVIQTYSAYIANVLNVTPRFNLLASLRADQMEADDAVSWSGNVEGYSQLFFSPKFGAVYQVIPQELSLFANYQNSFTNLGYITVDDQFTQELGDPEQANQIEAGIKTDLFNGRLSATLSAYQIKVENTLLTRGYIDGIAISEQSGELESKGVEIDVKAYPVDGLTIVAGFSYNESKYIEAASDVKNLRPNTAGSPLLANFYIGYEFQNTLKGIGLGLGGNYANENKIYNSSEFGVFSLPSYFVLNANAYYDTKQWRFAIRANNLTDEQYWIGFTTANPQRPLSVIGSVTYKLN